MTGQGSESRRLPSSAEGGQTWCQTPLVPVDHLQVTARVLYDRVRRLGRYQVEVTDPNTRELLALRSRPFHEGLSARETQEEAHKWCCEAIEALTNPDPF